MRTRLIIALLILPVLFTPRIYGKTEKIGKLIKPLEKMGVYEDGMPVTIQITDKRDNPLAGALVRIESEIEPRELTADENGYVTFRISGKVRDENPVMENVKPGYEGEIVVGFSFTASLEVPDGVKPKLGDVNFIRAELADLSSISDEATAVYYPESRENQAREIYETLKAEREFIRARLGFDPIPWALILTEKKDNDGFQQPGSGYKFFVYPMPGNSEQLIWINIHEWTEQTLDAELDLHDDKRNRWIFDGIPEILGYLGQKKMAAGDLNKALEDTVNLLRRGKDDDFTLSEWKAIKLKIRGGTFEGRPVGYPVSLAFWHELIEKHGEKVTADFLKAVRKAGAVRHKELTKILSDITGEDIKKKLKNYGAVQAQRTLDKMWVD